MSRAAELKELGGSHVPWRPPGRRLFALSFLMLFVELVLIRWSAAYIVYLAYFTNFVLLASFLGIGLGFLRAKAKRDLFPWVPVALAAYIAFVSLFPVQVERAEVHSFAGLFGWIPLPIWLSLPLIFLGVTVVMALLGEGVGRAFATFEPLEAYRLDILGSIAGIATFSLLSFLQSRPVVWGAVVALALVGVLGRHMRSVQWVAIAAVVALFGVGSLSSLDHWSPYYRVTVDRPDADGVIGIRVNGLPHQAISPIDRLRAVQHFYFTPYELAPSVPLDDVLIVGAGNGNDVAVALSEGAQRVDAVEIDPVIYGAGRDLHPDQPYQDPRVTVHIDDGRAFLERADRRYDLILFALPDSLTLVTGQSSLRLESYLFTEEAMREVREHLAPGGVFAMYNYYRPFVFDRFAETLSLVYGHPPCIERGSSSRGRQQAVLADSPDPSSLRCSSVWASAAVAPKPATDDHPFPYLPGRTIPGFYLLTLLLILVASVVIVRVVSGPLDSMGGYLDLFFMGAAFLLLETKNVVQFALLFGTTWFVNALVFTGILLAVLSAVEVARRWRPRRPALLYAALAAALSLAWAIPEASLLSLSPVARFVAGVSLAFAPVFLANLVFAERFRDVGSSTVAFGANLLGAMVGGVLEYSALVIGYRELLVVAAAMYLFAFLAGRRYLAPAGTVSV